MFFSRILPLFLAVACFAPVTLPAELFTYAELIRLFDEDDLSPEMAFKLNRLLSTPFVDNSYVPAHQVPVGRSDELGEFLRVAHWNIERGLEYPAIEAVFGSEESCERLLDNGRFPPGSPRRRRILEQAAALRSADVIVLNEVDWGLKRTNYRHVAAELAKHLGMNYTFGVQFIELTPVHLSRDENAGGVEAEIAEEIRVDPARYKGLHGIAILSRFPLENVRFAPFKTHPYDWYKAEKKGASLIENGKRQLMKTVFLEKVMREVRRGGRTTLLADIADPRFPSGRITIAATHLENRTKPKYRLKQLNELLEAIRDIRHPVILSGDMNTSDADLTPTSFRRELKKRYGDPKYLAEMVVQYALGIGIVENAIFGGLALGRKLADPTVRHIPFVSPNAAHGFFARLKAFRFADGGAFDFRGDPSRSTGRKRKTLANSNERGRKGFVTTYTVKRPIYIFGKYKLDWIFVKPASLDHPTDHGDPYRFAPHFGRTLSEINSLIRDNISDHHPMIVDLPLSEPGLK